MKNERRHQKTIMAWISLTKGIAKNMIDTSKPLLLNPGGIEAARKFIYTQYVHGVPRTTILAFFDKDKLMNAVTGNVNVRLEIKGQLRSGREFKGTDMIRIVGRSSPKK